jgi:hypothetical protein
MLNTVKNKKRGIYKLIDSLSDSEAYTVKKFVEFLLTERENARIAKVLLDVPEEDKGISKEELRELKEAKRDVKQRCLKPLEVYKAEHGL